MIAVIRLHPIRFMLSPFLWLGILLAVQIGCSSRAYRNLGPETISKLRPLLNSERIQHQFGSYGIDVLAQSDEQRVSDLYSGAGSGKITRTLALVEYIHPRDTTLVGIHRRIVSGGSIGATFKAAGWQVSKQRFTIGTYPRHKKGPHSLLNRMQIAATGPPLAKLQYRLDVSRGGKTLPYAWITEIYHPEYLTIDDLNALY